MELEKIAQQLDKVESQYYVCDKEFDMRICSICKSYKTAIKLRDDLDKQYPNLAPHWVFKIEVVGVK